MKKIYWLLSFIVLSVGLISCGDDDDETLSCAARLEAYNDSLTDLSDYLDQVDEDSIAFTCSEFEPLWSAYSTAFDELCDENKAQTQESFDQIEAGVLLVSVFGGCDIEFD